MMIIIISCCFSDTQNGYYHHHFSGEQQFFFFLRLSIIDNDSWLFLTFMVAAGCVFFWKFLFWSRLKLYEASLEFLNKKKYYYYHHWFIKLFCFTTKKSNFQSMFFEQKKQSILINISDWFHWEKITNFFSQKIHNFRLMNIL